MKAKFEFTLPEENEEFLDAFNGSKYKYVIEEIWNEVFRKNRKHGYNNPKLDSDEAYEIIEELIKIYLEVTEDVR